jgi:hypothetical protein
MSQPDYGLDGGERFPVTLSDGTPGGRKATVIISGVHRQTITLETSTLRETHLFSMLLDDHRRGATKEWVRQVPILVARLEAVFATERQAGKNPYLKMTVDSGGARYENLLTGNNLYMSLDEMKRRLRAGEQIPAVFNVAAVRAKLGLA